MAFLFVIACVAACAETALTRADDDDDAGARGEDDARVSDSQDSGVPAVPSDSGVAADGGAGQVDSAVEADAGEIVDPLVPACSTEVATQLARMRVPGLSAGIIKNGRLVCTAVAGHANIEEQKLVTPETVFAWASVSKTVTAVAAMILYEEGRFGLDDDINNYLPFSVRNPNCEDDPITFRQLMTHSSSIIDNDTVYEASYTIGDSQTSLADFVRGYVVPGGTYYDEEENFDSDCPGEVNDYSNVAVGLLGHLVATIAGTSFDQFCRDRIFTPLGMTETSFHLANLNAANVAMPYDGTTPANFAALGHTGFPTYPDGLLRTSVPHLARFLAMMAGLGVYDGQRILSEASVQEMRRLQIAELDDTQGLMWFYSDYGARTGLFGHDGDDPGTSSMMFFDPRDSAGVLLVANGYWYNRNEDSPEADALFEALFTEANNY